MYFNDTLQRAAPSRGGLARTATNALRWVLYGVLALCRRVIIPLLMGLSAGGALLWFIFVPLAHDREFPSAHVLGLSALCAVVAIAYLAVMELLVPGSLSDQR